VSRGIRRLGATDSVSDDTFFDLANNRYIRRETRDYVPKLIAATIIAKSPDEYGFHDVPNLQPLLFDEMTVSDATGLDVIARLADTTTAAIVELNPSYYRGATPPGESAVVRVPRGTGQTVAQRFQELPPEDRVNFVEHRIRNGETLSEIAVRYGVSVRLLMATNRGLQPRRLRIGTRLTIPISPAARAGSATPVNIPRASTARPPTGPGRRHTVRRGESLWEIARRYNTSVARLRDLNNLVRGEVLRVGQVLIVSGVPATHTVRSGESLWIIARRYGLDHGNLRQWNELSTDVLRVGQVLRLSAP
jgi:membrane-bound lytic murein transglycosylase D